MNRLYLIPIESYINDGIILRGPKYFSWRYDPDPPALVDCLHSMMDYGFTDFGLILAKDITQINHDALVLNADVFSFPENLDLQVSQDIQPFFEAIHLPTDWVTPATTYLELLRQTAGMFQFNQRYGGIAANDTGEIHSIFDTAALETRLRKMTIQEQACFLATVDSFGYDSALVSTNAKLRLLVKQAGSYWDTRPFYLGGLKF